MTTDDTPQFIRDGGLPRHTHQRYVGSPVTVTTSPDWFKGRPFALIVHDCGRCGSTGRYPSSMYDGVCLLCKGAAKLVTRTKLYTQAELDKMNLTRDKKRAKKNAALIVAAEERAAAVASRREAWEAIMGEWVKNARAVAGHIEFVADILAKGDNNADLSTAQIAAVDKAVARELETQRFAEASVYLGEEGDKVTVEGDVVYQDGREGRFGWSYFHVIKTATGKVTQRGSFIAGKGARVRFVATVKEHDTDRRDGGKVTVVQRVRKLEVLRMSDQDRRREEEREERRIDNMQRDAMAEASADKRPLCRVSDRKEFYVS